jgi:hypothetical protein
MLYPPSGLDVAKYGQISELFLPGVNSEFQQGCRVAAAVPSRFDGARASPRASPHIAPC